MVRFLCSGGGEKVFTLLTEVVVGYIVITSINVKKACLEEAFTRAFCNCGSGFYYCSNDVLCVLICINPWKGLEAYKNCC